jgi:predicted HicB family RNase H-like nuclease
MATRVITVRMPAELHERFKAAARWKCLSMNDLAIMALLEKIGAIELERETQKTEGGEPT